MTVYALPGLGSFVDDLAAAIQRFEGTCPSPTNCQNNNPGNLTAGPGSIGTSASGFAIFPDYQTGLDALDNQINLNIGRGLNLDQFFGGQTGVYPGYAPAAAGNDPTNYANTVASWLGIDPSTPLSAVATSGASDSFGSSTIDTSTLDTGALSLSTTAWAGIGLLALALVWTVMR